MKSFSVRFVAFCLGSALLLQGCGGGSLGTGVRTLQSDKIEEHKKPVFKWPTLWTPSCRARAGEASLSLQVESELGSGAVLEHKPGCTFLIPEQAQSVELKINSIPSGAVPKVQISEASCVDGVEISGSSRNLLIERNIAKLPTPRWHTGTYIKLLVQLGPIESTEARLLNDDFENCPFIAPEDDQ